jgi:membrane-bound lytic murein transglycosylase MltF
MFKAWHQITCWILFFIIILFCAACSDDNLKQGSSEAVYPNQEEEEAVKFDERQLFHRVNQPFHGDLEEIRERRLIRVLVSYSKTNFFIDAGIARGFEYELLHAYEKFLNQSIPNRYNRTKMVFILVPFDQLLTALKDGRGDIAAAGLTITKERENYVRFTDPYIPDVREVVVLNRKLRGIESIDDLSGQKLYVLSGSSFVTHLEKLNEKFIQQGRSPIEVVTSDPYLVSEDILELLNADVLHITVSDQHIAEAWSQVLTDIVVRKDIQINTGGRIAWAVRKENEELLTHLNTFIKNNKKGSLLGNILIKRYHKHSKWIKNPVSLLDQKKLGRLIGLFNKYADYYGFDWLAIAAQAYQESGLDNSQRSPDGAVGILQVLPKTAAHKSVNITDIHLLENNIHAGVKYLHFLRERYFSDPAIEPASRINLSWAAYNAGPAKINKLRKIAQNRGFDPNKWFFNVEKIASEFIGRETVEYVANINKYYVAYKLEQEENEKRKRSLKTFSALQGR